MKEYKSVKKSFKDCPFQVQMPKILVVEPYLEFSFMVGLLDHKTKYILRECTATDKLGYKVHVSLEDQSNFGGSTKHKVSINDKKLWKSTLTLTLGFLTADGCSIDVTYHYDKNNKGQPILIESVAVAEMRGDEKSFFASSLLGAAKAFKKSVSEEKESNCPLNAPTSDFDNPYIKTLSSEMYFLKNNGGKKYKVTDGRLLTPNSDEFCYSFELESELYLSDDAPVSVKIGMKTVNGMVIMCDGFQIIVSLKENIGEKIPSAEIHVEPWKLLEKLRDRMIQLSPDNQIAWELFHNGPALADNASNIETIKRGQEAAIRHAVNEDISVVWGPPGTGKTYTMAKMTAQFVLRGKSVLIVSHSNISVDNLVKQIYNQFSQSALASILPQGKVLRYGFVRDEELSRNEDCVAFNYALKSDPALKEKYESFSQESKKLRKELQFKSDPEKAKKLKDVEEKLKEIRAKLKLATKNLAAKAQVVATTVSKTYMDKLFEGVKYDVVMFDEVSMAYVPQLLSAAMFAEEKFICVGDFRQLSPIVQSDKGKTNLQYDIFSFFNISRNGKVHNHPWLVMLNEQRRMHPHISRFSNQHIYAGLLKDHPSVISKWNEVTALEPMGNQAMNLVDIAGTFCAAGKNADNSRFNIFSAILAFAIALKAEKEQKGILSKNEEKVGIITPYAAQTRLIRAMIQDYRQSGNTAVSCATVHQFQGSERNVIIFDAVESYPFTKPGWLVSKNENESVMRLINVALTRARCKFITLANTKFWYSKFHETQNTYFALLGHIGKNDHVVSTKENALMELIHGLDFGKNITVFFTTSEAWAVLQKDIQSAKKRIIVTLPTDKLNRDYEGIVAAALMERARFGVSVIGKAKKTEMLNETWKNLLHETKTTAFPLIAVDDRVAWYGFPLTELFFEDKNYKFYSPVCPIFRIQGKYTNEMIHSLCELEYGLDENGYKVKLMEKANSKAGKGLAEYVSATVKCKKCGAAVHLTKSKNNKIFLRCSACNAIDFLSVYTVNKYLEKVKGKCSVCGKDTYAAQGPYGIYVKCSNRHHTKLSEL